MDVITFDIGYKLKIIYSVLQILYVLCSLHLFRNIFVLEIISIYSMPKSRSSLKNVIFVNTIQVQEHRYYTDNTFHYLFSELIKTS